MRKIIPINFSWYVKPYADSDLDDIDLNHFKQVHIPNQPIDIYPNYFSLKNMKQKFSYYYALKDIDFNLYQHIFLQFDGVAIESDIYINKQFVCNHQSGYTPYRIDIKKYINSEMDHQEILVIVSGIEKKDVPPFGGVVDYLGYVGIYREVYLDLIENQYIKDVYMYSTDPIESDKLNIEVKTSDHKGFLSVEVLDIEKKSVLKQDFKINDYKSLLEIELNHKKLWSLDNPYLYEVIINYKNKDMVFDIYAHSFGFRKIEFRNDGFYLNQQMIKLMGINRHQSYPFQGYAMPKGAQKDDADILKRKLGVDIVRSSHYPCSKHFLNRADEIGLLVFEEVPGWQYIGNETFKKITYESLTHMIKRDRNHASICLWGVRINESADDHDFYEKTNDIARTLDPYRQTCGIRNTDHSEFLEDVYTYNDFSHTGQNPGIIDKDKIVKHDVPYLITEHTGHMFPVKAFDSESVLLEQAKRHLKVLNDAFDPKNHVSGAIGWVMSDYQTHPSFGSVDGICHHGVLDMYRMPKIASYGYLSQTEKPFIMEVSSSMNIGEHPGGMLQEVYVFTNLDSVKVYKNDLCIDTFYPDFKSYPNLKHPPVIIKDFIGNMIFEQENMSQKDADTVKKIITYVMMHGNKLPLRFKLKMAFLLKKYKLTFDDGMKLFYKYTSGWGDEQAVYRFEGYKENVKVKEIIKTRSDDIILTLKSNKSEIIHDQTYDTLRFELLCYDSYKQIRAYLFDPVEINVSGAISLIGPSIQSLNSGQLAFWVKSESKGKGYIKVKMREQIIEKEVTVK